MTLKDDIRSDGREADEGDRASSEALASAAGAMHAHSVRSAAVLGPAPRADGSCHDCSDPVEEGRLALGLGRCLSCAEELEALARRRKMGRG